MNYWYDFWVLDFIVAGAAFVFILVMVAVKGVTDLLQMFRLLEQEHHSH